MKFLYCIVILVCLSAFGLQAQKLSQRVSNLQSSWVGNSFGGGLKWVQHTVDEMRVSPDGTINTWTFFDEANRNFGVYKGFQREDGTWYGDVIGNKFEEFNGGAVKIGKSEWYIEGYVDYDKYDEGRTRRTGTIVKRKNSTIQITGLQKATSLGVDHKNNYLMITDDGPEKHVVLFYDTLGNFIKQIGTAGGIWPSSVGGDPSQDGVIDSDLKFYYLAGCGADSNGNIYVGMSEIYGMAGFWIRCFNPAGTTLLWELHSHYFTDFSDMDRTKDGKEVYSTFRKYEMDFTRGPGEQYTLKAFTFNPYKFPNDQRKNSSSRAPQVRYINGKKFLFYTGQNTHGFWIYKFDQATHGETAIPTGIYLGTGQNSITVDMNGDFWAAPAGELRLRKCTGIDPAGNPVYAPHVAYPKPPEFGAIMHCYYIGGPDDEMLVSGFEPGETDAVGYSQVGKVLARYKNWTTAPSLMWINKNIPFIHKNALPVGVRIVNKSVFEAGDYIFIDYVIHNAPDYDVDAPGVINVYKKSDGTFVGEIFAGPEINWQASWHDIQISFNVMQRANGEYFLLSEDNWKSKTIIYRWCPSGTCANFNYATVSVSPSDKYAVESTNDPSEFTFTRTSTTNSLTVHYTVTGSTLPGDYTSPPSGTINFAPGQTEVKLKLFPVNDGTVEGDEKLILSLTKDANYWIKKGSEVASTYLFDTPKPSVRIYSSSPTIKEDGSDEAAIVIKRDIFNTDLKVSVKITGTASKLDYNYPSVIKHVILPAGQRIYTLSSLKANQDLVVEGDEEVTISFVDSTNYLVVDSSSVSVIIKDDDASTDPPGVISCYPFTANVTIDGVFDEPQWKFINEIRKDHDGANNNQAFFAVGWDTMYYYLAIKVYDDVLRKNNSAPWENDGAEIYIDGNNNDGSLDINDDQFIMNYGELSVLWSAKNKLADVKYKSLIMPGNIGYTIEMAIPWYSFVKTLSNDLKIGFDISIDDNDDTKRYNAIVWNGDGNNYNSTSKYGDVILKNTAGWKLGKTHKPGGGGGPTEPPPPPVVTGSSPEVGQLITIYPNPLQNGELNIDLGFSNMANVAIQIYDIQGKPIYQTVSSPRNRLHVSRDIFPGKGIYFIKVKDNKNVIVKKISVL